MYRRCDRSAGPNRRVFVTHAAGTDAPPDGGAPVPGGETVPASFTPEAVDFLRELPARRLDPAWHADNRTRYEQHVHRPLSQLLSCVREKFVEPLSPEVARGRRQLSAVGKNGYGKGGFHDHCRFAFYDPAVSSKARSPQLYFAAGGEGGAWGYGLCLGPQCEAYARRLRRAAREAPDAVFAHLKDAPAGAAVTRRTRDHARRWPAAEWRELLKCDADLAFGSGLGVTEFSIGRSFPLAELPEHDATEGRLAEEVGTFFAWAWPFFEASRTGVWPLAVPSDPAGAEKWRADGAAEVDEDAPATLEELARATSLPVSLLEEMERAILSKGQIVLSGPPGTSKTFAAAQFARYLARQRPGQPQGLTHTLYLHPGWAYEDFFEGLRPVDQGGRLVFENKPGHFLRWVGEDLRGQPAQARHVLVLDELNRCDTAAVLGELLQLLECRGVTVPLLSGRPFVLPANLYVIGTMNSADRSVGRIDLALRRRFYWIDLLPQPDALRHWLGRQSGGGGPAALDAEALPDALQACNDLLAGCGVPCDQQIGHALFMGTAPDPVSAEGGGGAPGGALTPDTLRQIVQCSVLPYVRELLTTQPGQLGEDVVERVRSILLACATPPPVEGRVPLGAKGAAGG